MNRTVTAVAFCLPLFAGVSSAHETDRAATDSERPLPATEVVPCECRYPRMTPTEADSLDLLITPAAQPPSERVTRAVECRTPPARTGRPDLVCPI